MKIMMMKVVVTVIDTDDDDDDDDDDALMSPVTTRNIASYLGFVQYVVKFFVIINC